MKHYEAIVYENHISVFEEPGRDGYKVEEVGHDGVTHIVRKSDIIEIKFDSGLIKTIPLDRVFSLERVRND